MGFSLLLLSVPSGRKPASIYAGLISLKAMQYLDDGAFDAEGYSETDRYRAARLHAVIECERVSSAEVARIISEPVGYVAQCRAAAKI